MVRQLANDDGSRDGPWITRRRDYLTLLVGLSGALSGCPGGTPPAGQGGTPLPSATARNALFGASVAIDGETALVGASQMTEGENTDVDTDVAFVFSREGEEWTPETTLRPDRPASGFGESVELAGDTALIAARDDSRQNPESTEVNGEPDAETGDQMGAVFAFSRTSEGWVRDVTITPSDAGSWDKFGHSLAMDGDTAVIGALLDEDPNGAEGGSAYIFKRTEDGWTEQAKLAGDHQDAHFGAAVAIDGDTAIICANQDETPNGPDEGAAYVFVRGQQEWSQQAKLFVEHKLNGAVLGESVAVDGNTAFVGAPRENTVYVFSRTANEWSMQKELYPEDVEQREGMDPGDTFGGSIALTTDVALVGAPTQDDGDSSRAGSVYVYTRTEGDWRRQAKLIADDGDSRDAFGTAVALAGDTALVTAPHDEDTDGGFAGTTHTFVRSSRTWERQAELTASAVGPFETATNPTQSPSTSPEMTRSPSQNTTAMSLDE